VLSRLRRGNTLIRVQTGRSRNGDHVRFRLLEHLLVGSEARDTIVSCGLFSPRWIGIANRD